MLYPLKFHPILKSSLWGGEKIIPFKGLELGQTMVGESWELSGVSGDESIVANGTEEGKSITELIKKYGVKLLGKANYERFGSEFPLLIKFIDARDDLSIQVHPDDKLAEYRHNSKGKTEMWYIVDADKGAKLRSGFSRKITPQEYIASVEKDTVTDILAEYEVEKGDLFFLPAGRIHSIGAGCFIAEIQQTSNITYRIYDFNRTDAEGKTRELHTDLAVDAIDYAIEADYRTEYERNKQNSEVKMVECNYFKTSILSLTESRVMNYHNLDSFVIYICTEGEAEVNGVSVTRGETLLLPANLQRVNIETTGCTLLITHI